MSERMTAIYLLGMMGSGIADRGRKTVPEMISLLRYYARISRANAEAVLAAQDSDFRVETYVGVHARNKSEIIQEGVPAKVST